MSLMAPPQPLPDFEVARLRAAWKRPVRLPGRPGPELREDAALLAGLAAIAAGCGWIFPPAAAIVGGLFLVALALKTASGADREEQLREPTPVVEQYVFGDLEED